MEELSNTICSKTENLEVLGVGKNSEEVHGPVRDCAKYDADDDYVVYMDREFMSFVLPCAVFGGGP